MIRLPQILVMAIALAIIGLIYVAFAVVQSDRGLSRTLDGCRLVGVESLKGAESRRGKLPVVPRWSVAPGLAIAYHVKESDIWFAQPLADTKNLNEAPLWVLSDDEVRRAAASFPRKALPTGSFSMESVDLRVRIDAGERGGSVWLELEDGYQHGEATFKLSECLP